MRAAINPFSPGSGRKPPALAGRDSEIRTMSDLVERTNHDLTGRPLLLVGLRGVGKTVLLNEMRSAADDAEWITVGLEARAGSEQLRNTLARELSVKARPLAGKGNKSEKITRALKTVTAFRLKLGVAGVDLGVELDHQHGRADSGLLEVDLVELIEDLALALKGSGRAFGLFIDELQDLDSEMLGALLTAQHRASQQDWPFYLIGAGLPNIPGILAETRSYAERMFHVIGIDRLTGSETDKALVEPARRFAVEFTEPALARLREVTSGYPYFIQEFGSAAWEVADASPIDLGAVDVAVETGIQLLDDGFFKARWDRATPAERRLLVAMADDGTGPSTIGAIAERLGRKVTSLGPARAALIAKGLVYSPEHGQLAYTVPGMADFTRRNRENVDDVGR